MISRLPAPPIRLPLPRPSLPLLPAALLHRAQAGAGDETANKTLGGTAMAAGSQVAATIGQGLFGRALLVGALGATAVLLIGQLLNESEPSTETLQHD